MAKCRYYYRTEKSREVFHKDNEDYMMHSRFSLMNDMSMDVFVIADGMGGMEGGREASQTAVFGFMNAFYQEIMGHYVPQRENFTITHYCDRIQDAMVCAIKAANRDVCGHAKPGIQTGTTLSAAVLVGNYLIVGNVGDSPVYYYCAKSQDMQVISALQTKAEQDCQLGKYERFSREYFENDYILVHFIGEYEELTKDIIAFHIVEQVDSGDMLLLCSDGAVGQRTPYEVAKILLEGEERHVLRTLFDRANQDKEDDQTAIWVKIV